MSKNPGASENISSPPPPPVIPSFRPPPPPSRSNLLPPQNGAPPPHFRRTCASKENEVSVQTFTKVSTTSRLSVTAADINPVYLKARLCTATTYTTRQSQIEFSAAADCKKRNQEKRPRSDSDRDENEAKVSLYSGSASRSRGDTDSSTELGTSEASTRSTSQAYDRSQRDLRKREEALKVNKHTAVAGIQREGREKSSCEKSSSTKKENPARCETKSSHTLRSPVDMNESSTMGKLHAVQGVCHFLGASEFYDSSASGVTATSRLEHLHAVFRARVLNVFGAANLKGGKDGRESGEESEDDLDEKDTRRATGNGNSFKDANSLSDDLSFNAKNRLNDDGKACQCSKVLRGYGIKHGHLVGEEKQKFSCKTLKNNAKSLFCYRIVLDPTINFTSTSPTKIRHSGADFDFHGFCILSHVELCKYPYAQTTRFNVIYTMALEQIPVPATFVVEDLNLFKLLFFTELLELRDWRLKAESFESMDNICDILHLYPMFVRGRGSNLEVAPMSSVLYQMALDFHPIFTDDDVELLQCAPDHLFEESVRRCRGSLVAFPGRRPAVIRVDQIDKDARDVSKKDRRDCGYPALIHFTTRATVPGSSKASLQKVQKKLDQMRNVLETRPKNLVTPEDKIQLHNQQAAVDEQMRKLELKKDATVVLSARGFYYTGIRSDMAQYGTIIPCLTFHFRYHISLDLLEEKLGYRFTDRNLLELALTHPSYRTNFGTNGDHVRNVQANLGFRKAVHGHLGAIPKSGIKTLIHTMAQLGAEDEMLSPIKNYERLEFLGDAVLEFLTSLRLFLIFPDIQEGGLATFRATLVQNSHLAVLGETYNLSHYLLISHGREMSSRNRITDKHAAANCFEAICGAIYLDGGIKFVDDFFGRSLTGRLFLGDEDLSKVWMFPPPHISVAEYPAGDRHLIQKHELLQRCVEFEELTGIQFHHVRLLANAFSSRAVHDNGITIGNNQRLEFLGDTVLQLIVSDHLFKHFPKHHEGHLSLLRSSLVSNKTQAYVCEELTMAAYQIKEQGISKSSPSVDIKMKDKADLVEAFLGALYLDKGLTVCHAFCKIVFFPKLTDFIVNQSWSDPKSRLQQCCLTLRSFDGGTPKLPEYKIINKVGPSNNRMYDVAVYFNGERLATGTASNTKLAEEAAAEKALKNPVFLPDYQRQQNFARRAVAAQKAQRCKRSSSLSRSTEKRDSYRLPQSGSYDRR